MGLARQCFGFLSLAMCLFGCSSEDGFTSNVGGKYAIALTNDKSTCNWENWHEGAENQVNFTIAQEGKALTGKLELDALSGAVFNAIFGDKDFMGNIEGDSFTLTRAGTALAQGNCAYSFNSTVDGTQNGDSIAGTITYETVTNGNPDCDAVQCSASQRFNGSRPPQ